MVGSRILFHVTPAFVVKFVPVSASVNVGPPTVAAFGATVVNVGMVEGCPMVSVTVFDRLPLGFCTVTAYVPAVPVKAGPTLAVSCVELLKLVISVEVPNWMIALLINPDPFTVRLKPPLPGSTVVGLIEEIVGPVLAPIVNVAAALVAALVVTVMAAEPVVAMKLAGTTAVSWVEVK